MNELNLIDLILIMSAYSFENDNKFTLPAIASYYFQLDTNIEFKFLIFENGVFKDWEKLPNNGNRYYYNRFCKVCLEMREYIPDIRERVLMKFSSENEIIGNPKKSKKNEIKKRALKREED